MKIDEDDYYDGQSLEYDDGHDNEYHDACVPKLNHNGDDPGENQSYKNMTKAW